MAQEQPAGGRGPEVRPRPRLVLAAVLSVIILVGAAALAAAVWRPSTGEPTAVPGAAPGVAAASSASRSTPSATPAELRPGSTLEPDVTAQTQTPAQAQANAKPRSGSGGRLDRATDAEGSKKLARRVEALLAQNVAATVFRVSTFNVLGASHTRTGGNKGTRPSGAARMGWVVQLLERHRVDVVGFQEYEPVQDLQFRRLVGDSWQVFPGPHPVRGAIRQSIAWRTDTWELVDSDTVAVPYFRGKLIPMPVVLLAHRATGRQVYVANFHNPATTGQYGQNEAWRDRATQIEIDLVNRLRTSGVPVIVTGDMNERDEYFCKMTSQAPMVAANGGINAGGACAAPRPSVIDWIFATTGVTFSDYVRDVSPLVRRASDHPMFAATVLLPTGP